MAFNVIARNQDDHVKNIAFLMDRGGRWRLSPAFDVTYSYNPAGAWTATHQMTLNGKRDGFTLDDFRACARRRRPSHATPPPASLREVTEAPSASGRPTPTPPAWRPNGRREIGRHLRLGIAG